MNNERTTLRKWKSAKDKYTMTAYCYDKYCTFELEHKENGSTVSYQSGMKTPLELNKKIYDELNYYKLDGITLEETE